MNIELSSITAEKSKGVLKVAVNVKNRDQLDSFINRMRGKSGVSDVFRR